MKNDEIKLDDEENSQIFDLNLNITFCPLCKNGICYLQPILDKNSNPLLLYKCSETNIDKSTSYDNNFLIKNRTIPINEYFNFIHDRTNFKTKNKCCLHENDNETLFCIQCEEYFCKNLCVQNHNDLITNHMFSEVEIKFKKYCNLCINKDKFKENKNDTKYEKEEKKKKYKIRYYCEYCNQFFCDNCKKDPSFNNDEHNVKTLKEINETIDNFISEFKNIKKNNIINKKEEEKEKLLNDESFKALNENLKKQLTNIVNNNLKTNEIFFKICSYIITIYKLFKKCPNCFLIGNILRFLNVNNESFGKNFNKDEIVLFYKTNYLIEFKKIKIFKAIIEYKLEKIQHIISCNDNTGIIMNCEMDEQNTIIFLDNKGKLTQNHIKLSAKGKITTMILVQNQLLVLGFTDKGHNSGKLKIYDISEIGKLNKIKKQYIVSAAHSHDIKVICEIKDYQILTLSENEKLIKQWNIKNEPLNINIFYFPNEVSSANIKNIIKFNKQKIILIGEELTFINKYEKNFYYRLLKINNLKLFYLLDETKYNISLEKYEKIFITIESECELLLYKTKKISKPKKYETIVLKSLKFKQKTVDGVYFLKKYFCCKLSDSLAIIHLDNNYNLNRLYLFNFYNNYLDRCLTFSSNSCEKIFFTKIDAHKNIIGYIIFEELNESSKDENIYNKNLFVNDEFVFC
jgi:hypothetical protein